MVSLVKPFIDKRQTAFVFFVIAAVFIIPTVPAQTTAVQNSADRQIKMLIFRLCNGMISPENALDPLVQGKQRMAALRKIDKPGIQLTITPMENIRIEGPNSASVQVYFDLKRGTSEFQGNGRIEFVLRNGTWYFANFDFLDWPILLIIVAVLGLAVAGIWAVKVLIITSKLMKAGRFHGINLIKVLLPFCWPGLLRQI